MAGQKINTMDDYILGFPKEVQEILEKLRRTIGRCAPEAEEAISYQIPTFKLGGNLVHFAGYRHHIGFYPGPSAITAFEKDLAGFKVAKGTIRFPLDKPLPYELVEKMVKHRVNELIKKKKKAGG